MIIKGLIKLSLIDYPEHLAAVVFTAGCNFRCPFCHNRELVLLQPDLPDIAPGKVLSFLRQRVGTLDGICVTGGEPTLQPDLPSFLEEIKTLGYDVKLDTNGTNPALLTRLLKEGLIDYLAIDFKAPLDERYRQFVQAGELELEALKASLRLVSRSKVPFELRTTVVPGFHTKKILEKMVAQAREVLEPAGWPRLKWYLQPFRPGNCLDPVYNFIQPFEAGELTDLLTATAPAETLLQLRQ